VALRSWRQWVLRVPLFKKIIFQAELPRCRRILEDLEPWLAEGAVLDIGAGSGVLAHLIRGTGRQVQALDVEDLSTAADIRPVVYDGQQMPFENKVFDSAVIAFVLHHTPNPDLIIAEAARVAKRVIILEDVIDGKVNEVLTKFLDSLVNLEFFGHPHSNRSHAEWVKSFERLGLKLTHSEQVASSLWLVKPMDHRMYILDIEAHDGN